MDKQNPDRHSFSGHILNEKLCLCAVCGRIAKMAGILKQSNSADKPSVVCFDCMAKHHVAKIHLENKEEIARELERVLLYSMIFKEIMAERYLKAEGRKEFYDEAEVKAFLEFVRQAWDELGSEFHQKAYSLSVDELKQAYRNVKVNITPPKAEMDRFNEGKPHGNVISPSGGGKKFFGN